MWLAMTAAALVLGAFVGLVLGLGWVAVRILWDFLRDALGFIWETLDLLAYRLVDSWRWWQYKRKYLREPWPQKSAPPPQQKPPPEPEPDEEPETVVIIEGFARPPRGAYRVRRRL